MFCGIGGFRLGLERANQIGSQAWGARLGNGEGEGGSDSARGGRGPQQAYDNGFRCVWANDNNRYACKVYRSHWGTGELVEADIASIDARSIPDHQLLTAGFPCQSFSVAGKRRGFNDTRGTLFWHIAHVAEAKRPPLLLLENVKGLLSAQEGECFAVILQTLDELGYDAEWQVLNSKHFGVPQNRERVFVVGHLRGAGTKQIFPLPERCETLNKHEKGIPFPTVFASQHKISRGMPMIQVPKNRADVCPHCNRQLRPEEGTSIKTESKCEIVCPYCGKSYSYTEYTVQPCLTPDRPRKRQHGRRFKEDGEEMFTLTGQDIHGVAIANAVDCDGYLRKETRPRDMQGKPQLLPIGYRRIRRLTPTECERLQGFPDGWTRGLSDTQRYKCLGNAVTVNVIQHLGGCILEADG